MVTARSIRTSKPDEKARPAPVSEERYWRSCDSDRWRKVFRLEADYLARSLRGCRDLLSVGCGSAQVEGELSRRGFTVTGLDASRAMLAHAPAAVRTVHARAEQVPFPDRSFDAVIFVASLEFIADVTHAVAEATRVLRPGGAMVAMLLNPRSMFYRETMKKPSSYLRTIRHHRPADMEKTLARHFRVHREYVLGIEAERVFQTRDPERAALVVVRGNLR